MTGPAIQDELRRFLLTSALTVPHVEAVLLLRSDAGTSWDARRLGSRLYIGDKRAAELLEELAAMGMIATADGAGSFRYAPATAALATVLDLLAETYSKHLVEVTELIHAADPAARQFADAFRFRKEP